MASGKDSVSSMEEIEHKFLRGEETNLAHPVCLCLEKSEQTLTNTR